MSLRNLYILCLYRRIRNWLLIIYRHRKGHAFMQYCLNNAAKHYGCGVRDLEYMTDKHGAVHIRKKVKDDAGTEKSD